MTQADEVAFNKAFGKEIEEKIQALKTEPGSPIRSVAIAKLQEAVRLLNIDLSSMNIKLFPKTLSENS
jgi:hypothetical protein